MKNNHRQHTESSLSSLLSSCITNPALAKIKKQKASAAAWNAVIGDIERKHTTGVFVIEPKIKGRYPILGVFVDSSSVLVDFNVNKEMYLLRLTHLGYKFDDILFKLSKYTQAKPVFKPQTIKSSCVSPALQQTLAPLPALSPQEIEFAEHTVQNLPSTLRTSALKAVKATLQRQKLSSYAKDNLSLN